MTERLTIKSGELNFYEEVYTKCSNKNSPEVRKKVKNGIPYYDIKEYKSKQYNTKELSDIYKKLSKLEDILEKYGIESVDTLEHIIKKGQAINTMIEGFAKEAYNKMQTDRDTWKRACELASSHISWCPAKQGECNCTEEKGDCTNFFYQQAKKEEKNDV